MHGALLKAQFSHALPPIAAGHLETPEGLKIIARGILGRVA